MAIWMSEHIDAGSFDVRYFLGVIEKQMRVLVSGFRLLIKTLINRCLLNMGQYSYMRS